MNECLKAHRHTKVVYCHKILPKSGPLSLLKNNVKAHEFYVKEVKEEVKEQSLQMQREPSTDTRHCTPFSKPRGCAPCVVFLV